MLPVSLPRPRGKIGQVLQGGISSETSMSRPYPVARAESTPDTSANAA
ncbi:MAG: hypothetical protein ACJ8EN_22825 [Xanthobacteraceae bacterium]